MDQYKLLVAFRTMDEIIEIERGRSAKAALASKIQRPRSHGAGATQRAVTLSLLLVFVLLLALIAATIAPTPGAAAFEATPGASTPSAASGRFAGLVDIGGRSLYLRCSGEGSPTVILEAGGNGTPSSTWWADSPVQAGIAEYTRVCSYDRANTYGRSDPAPLPRTGTEIVNDLHALLAAANVPGPYVMVAASTGGLISRLYASLYPDEVVGMVLLDTVHESLDARYAEILSYDLFRAYAELSGNDVDPEGIWMQGYLSDAIEYEVMSAQVASPIRPMPLVVITIDNAFVPSDFPPGWPADADNAMWRAMQQAQANLVPGGRLMVAENSSHNIHFDQPQVVIDTVREVVEAVRDPSAWDAVAASPAATPAASGEEAASGASGDFADLVDISGRSLYLECTGSGSPTVLLEAGNDGGVDTWALRGDLAEATAARVCAYNRANVGRSDATPLPRTGTDVVTDLHALLQAADVPGPYVFVGASLGGLFTRLYASTYPDDVVGMVLLDTSYEEQDARTEAMVSPELWAALEQEWGTFRDGEGFFPDGFLSDTLVSELRQAREDTPLRPMPLIVVTIETPCDASCFPAGWPVEDDNALWRAMQEEQAALVPGGRLVVSESNEHYLQQADPDLVIESVRQVVEAVRDPGSWEAPSATSGDFADRIDIGGRSLYLHCQGSGNPTVILEAGLDTTSETWSSLMPEVATLTRVCAYDRANLGASDRAPRPRTGDDVVSDLQALLQAADVPGPYVFVAASYGGIYDRLFAHTYPDDVAGLVLLDPTHEDEDAHLAEALGPDLWGELVDQGWLTSGEDIDFAATRAQLAEARVERPLPAVPVVLLSAGRPSEPLPMPDWPQERVDPVLLALQEDLATLVLGQRWIVVANSGHDIHVDQPDAVGDAIRDVVEAVRDPSTWEASAASP